MIRLRRHAIALLAPLLLTLAGCAVPVSEPETDLGELRPGAYTIDPEHASLTFKVNHLGLSTFVGRFNRLDASLDFDPDNMAATRLEARVDLASVDTNVERLDRLLRGNQWFDVENHPVARFVTTFVTAGDGDTFLFTGDLSLHGETHPVTLTGRFLGGANNFLTGKYTLGFSAEGVISRSQFGIDRYADAVGEEVSIEVHAEFQRQ